MNARDASGEVAQWYSQRTSVLEVAGSVTRPNLLIIGRDFVINRCLTVGPLETTDKLPKSLRLVAIHNEYPISYPILVKFQKVT